MSFTELIDALRAFRDERDWAQFHSPQNLATALSIEVSELQELMLWKDAGEVEELAASKSGHGLLSDEVADVLIYALLFCDATGIDPEAAIRFKLGKNAERYPVEKAKGSAAKYTELVEHGSQPEAISVETAEHRTPARAVQLPTTMWPAIVAHADWGSNENKRWMCVAELGPDGRYCVAAPEPVGPSPTLIERMTSRAREGRALIGFDFPIGVPSSYADRAGVSSFLELLPALGNGRWGQFYDVAESAEEISPERPFYPMRPGGTKQHHLTEALSVDSMTDLLRRCDRKSETRGAASSIFWTLGGKQVGKAAIIGWRDVLAPVLADGSADVAIWPFDGNLHDLVTRHHVTIAETYPAEACLHLGMTPPGNRWSKTSQEGRRSQAPHLLAWAKRRSVELTPELSAQIEDGFGPPKDSEDPFDALVGLLSMLEVVMGHRPDGAPDDPSVRKVEGWILGQMVANPERAGQPNARSRQ